MRSRAQQQWVWTAVCVFSGALFPRCNCETDPGIGRAAVEMTLTLVEIDPCSMAAVPRRIPDDYDTAGLKAATDFGSRATREFELRSTGTAPLTITSIELSAQDDEFTLAIADANEMPAVFPMQIPASRDDSAPPALLIKVDYAARDSDSDLVQLVVKSDDPERLEVKFDLAAGRGRLEVCGTNGCVADARVDFGNVSKDGMKTVEVLLKNAGEGDLDLRDIKLESGSAEFCAPEATSIPEGVADCPLQNLCRVLKAGESYAVTITYAPIDGGEDTGVLRINSGDATRGSVDVPINATGTGPGVCACVVDGTNCVKVASIDFGHVDIGQSGKKTVRLESCGTEPAELVEADLEHDTNSFYVTDPEFSISRAFAPAGTLQPGEFAEGDIAYTPTAAGEHTGGLRFTSGQDRLKSWISLIGKAATCDLEALPGNVAFGTVAGGQFLDRTVLLANNGQKDCTVSRISDPTNNFSIQNKPQLPLTVAPGGAVGLTVRYSAPSRPSASVESSTFDVVSDEPAPDQTNTVQLNAEGGGAAICQLTIQPTGNQGVLRTRDGKLEFGAVNIGYRKTLPIRISNVGNTNCTLSSYTLTTQATGQFTARPSAPLPATLAPSTMASIDVEFAPTSGTSGTMFPTYVPAFNYVNFEVAGAGLAKTMWSIGISARPTLPSIDIIPDSVDFGLVTWERPRPPDNRSSCGSETRSVRIYNSGTGPLQINGMGIEIESTSDPVFMITSVTNGGTAVTPPYTMTIGPGGNAEVQIRFFPTRINPPVHTGLLVVHNDQTMQSTVPLRGEGTANSRQTDVFQQLADNKVDILWVVDDSCSMSEEQQQLANNFQYFSQFAERLNADWQIGVITTEINDAVSGKIWGCNGFNRIITRGDPQRVQAFQCASAVTSPPNGNRRPNPGGSDEAEAGLQAARIALDPPVRDMENAGFVRPDARLAVIIVSDEEDQSPGSVNLYVDFFRNVKGFRNPQLFSIATIVGDVPSGCATAAAGTRYYDAVQQLGGQFESVCSQNWQNLLQNIGLDVFALRTAWTLSRPADGSTITVRVNGQMVTGGAMNGWTFDAASNVVTFNGLAIPPAGATVEISYGARCLP